MATATPAAASEATRGERKEDAEGAGAMGWRRLRRRVAEEMVVDIMQLLSVVDQKSPSSGGQRKGDRRSMGKARRYLFKQPSPCVQLLTREPSCPAPASFTYSYSRCSSFQMHPHHPHPLYS